MNGSIVIALACALFLSGCRWLNDDEGFFVNRGDDYLFARFGVAANGYRFTFTSTDLVSCGRTTRFR